MNARLEIIDYPSEPLPSHASNYCRFAFQVTAFIAALQCASNSARCGRSFDLESSDHPSPNYAVDILALARVEQATALGDHPWSGNFRRSEPVANCGARLRSAASTARPHQWAARRVAGASLGDPLAKPGRGAAARVARASGAVRAIMFIKCANDQL